jgi:prepilin-type N-terminal cleavage/methylation domain-containing protein
MKSKKLFSQRKKGFTLIEVLMSMVILMILTAITVPNYIKVNKQNNVVAFTEQLKQLNTAIQIISEVPNENYKHYPNPLWIDYNKVSTDFSQVGTTLSKYGIPYIPNLDKTNKEFYYIISLNGTTDAIVQRYNSSGVVIDQTNIPYSLEIALETKYGRNAILKTYPIDLSVLIKYAPFRIELNFPKKPIEGTDDRGIQTKSVFNLRANQIFPGYAPGDPRDLTDSIPNDGEIEQPGYFVLIDNGDEKTIFYTGTDAIYKETYVHLTNY